MKIKSRKFALNSSLKNFVVVVVMLGLVVVELLATMRGTVYWWFSPTGLAFVVTFLVSASWFVLSRQDWAALGGAIRSLFQNKKSNAFIELCVVYCTDKRYLQPNSFAPYPVLLNGLSWIEAGLKGPFLESMLQDQIRKRRESIRHFQRSLSQLAQAVSFSGILPCVAGVVGIFKSLNSPAGQINVAQNFGLALMPVFWGLLFATTIKIIQLFLFRVERQWQRTDQIQLESVRVIAAGGSAAEISQSLQKWVVAA